MNSSIYGQMYGYPLTTGMGVGPMIFGSILLAVLLVCVIILKGYSLWFAAKRNEKWWFIALLVINTMGILEIIYIVFFVKKYHLGKGKSHSEHNHHPQA